MVGFVIQDAVRDFLLRNIDSVEELEILLWLRRTGEEATPETLSEELRSSVGSVSSRLEVLAARGLIAAGAPPNTVRYAPAAGLDAAVSLLADCYRDAPFKVMELIYTKPVDKIEIFAEAFRLGTKDKEKE